MPKCNVRLGLVLGLFLAPAAALVAQTVNLDFSSMNAAMIAFNGADGITFDPDASSGYDFEISSSNISGLVGYKGNIEGVFTVGAISSFGFGMFQGQEAALSGSGVLSISDGSDQALTTDIVWDEVMTLGSGGSLNPFGDSNLSNFAYSGSNPALLALSRSQSGTVAASFQFVPAQSLSSLESGAPATTSYSGSLQAIPEPSETAFLAGAVGLAGAFLRRKLRPAKV
jgi:hypothetical protein